MAAIPAGKYYIDVTLHDRALGPLHEQIMLPEPIVTLPPGVRPPVFTIETPEMYIPEDPVYSIKTERGSPLGVNNNIVSAITVYIPDHDWFVWKIKPVLDVKQAAQATIEGQLPVHEVYTVRISYTKDQKTWYVPNSGNYQPVRLWTSIEPEAKTSEAVLPVISEEFRLIRVQ